MSCEQFNIYLEEMNDLFDQSSDDNDNKDENDDIMNEAVCSLKVAKPEPKRNPTSQSFLKPKPKLLKKREPRLRFIMKPKSIKSMDQIRRRRLKNKYIHWSNKRRYEQRILLFPKQNHRHSYEDMDEDMESSPDYSAKQNQNINITASNVPQLPLLTETIDLDDSDEDDDSDGRYAVVDEVHDEDDVENIDDYEDDYKDNYRDNYKNENRNTYENDEENGKELDNEVRMDEVIIKAYENGIDEERVRKINRKENAELIENTSSSSSDYTDKSSSAEEMSPPPPLTEAPNYVPISTPASVVDTVRALALIQSPNPIQSSAPTAAQNLAIPRPQPMNLIPSPTAVAITTARPETKDCATNTSIDAEFQEDQEIFFSDEMNRLYPFFNHIISQHIHSLRSMESIQERVASMTREVASLKEQIQVKETELNKLIHQKKIREETLWRMMRLIKTFDMKKKPLEGHKFELIALKELEAAIAKHTPRPDLKQKSIKDMTAIEILSRRAKMTEEELVMESTTAGTVESFLNKIYPEDNEDYDELISSTRSLISHRPVIPVSPKTQKRRRSGAEDHSSNQYYVQSKCSRPSSKQCYRMEFSDDDDDDDDGRQNCYEQQNYKRYKSTPSYTSNTQFNDEDEREDNFERQRTIQNGPHFNRMLQLTENNVLSEFVDTCDGPFASTLEKFLTKSVLNRSGPQKQNLNNFGNNFCDLGVNEKRDHEVENGELYDENRQRENQCKDRDDENIGPKIEQRHREIQNKKCFVENKLVISDIPNKNYIPRTELNRERLVVRLEPPSTKICQHCGIHEAQFLCAECKNQWYCSRNCQVVAWKDHCDECE